MYANFMMNTHDKAPTDTYTLLLVHTDRRVQEHTHTHTRTHTHTHIHTITHTQTPYYTSVDTHTQTHTHPRALYTNTNLQECPIHLMAPTTRN